MAETPAAQTPAAPVGPDGGPASPPKVLPWLFMYTVGRLGVWALLTLVLWWLGLDLFSGLLFGLLLSMVVSYFALRPARERLSEGLVARRHRRQQSKEALRDRLSGE